MLVSARIKKKLTLLSQNLSHLYCVDENEEISFLEVLAQSVEPISGLFNACQAKRLAEYGLKTANVTFKWIELPQKAQIWFEMVSSRIQKMHELFFLSTIRQCELKWPIFIYALHQESRLRGEIEPVQLYSTHTVVHSKQKRRGPVAI